MSLTVMDNGLPGKMAQEILAVAKEMGVRVAGISLTGAEISDSHFQDYALVRADAPNLSNLLQGFNYATFGGLIATDFTQPSATSGNIHLYCQHNIPFVMGTTGVDKDEARDIIGSSAICAVIAPNMSAQIVALQAAMDYMAATFPDAFKGFNLLVTESHQNGKKDTSGTARAMVRYFNALGMPFDESQIVQIRDPEQQRKNGIPEQFLGGHGHHDYEMTSPDGVSAYFRIIHNINGRRTYAEGAIKAAQFLYRKMQEGEKGKIFSMFDVLQNQ